MRQHRKLLQPTITPIGLLLVFLLLIFILGCQAGPAGWRLETPRTSPPPLYYGRIEYMSSTQTAILFGGSGADFQPSGETWVWDGTDWKKLNPVHSPQPRERFGMAYDEQRDRIVLFGGMLDQDGQKISVDDTWEWDGADWRQMSPNHRPPARCCNSLAYDSANRRILLNAGWENEHNTFYNDTWAWDGSDWTQLAGGGNIPVISGNEMVGLPEKATVLNYLSDRGSWTWEGSNWELLRGSEPPGRTGTVMVYDQQHRRAVLFGGGDETNILNDTWVFENDTEQWLELRLSNPPEARFGHMAFYDLKLKKLMVFGGYDSAISQVRGDFWSLNLPADLSGMLMTPGSGQ